MLCRKCEIEYADAPTDTVTECAVCGSYLTPITVTPADPPKKPEKPKAEKKSASSRKKK